MKKRTRGFVAFVGSGCLLAGAIGWGVWRVSTPEDHVSAHTQVTRTEPSIGQADAGTTMAEPHSTEPSTPVQSSDSVDPASQFYANDPLLPPNAYIPTPGSGNAGMPTRTYALVNPTQASSSTTQVIPGSNTMTSKRPTEPTPIPGDSGDAQFPQETSNPPSPVTPPPSTEQVTTVVTPVPTSTEVSPPTLAQPQPTTVGPATSALEPVPVVTTVPAVGTPEPSTSVAPTSTSMPMPLPAAEPIPRLSFGSTF